MVQSWDVTVCLSFRYGGECRCYCVFKSEDMVVCADLTVCLSLRYDGECRCYCVFKFKDMVVSVDVTVCLSLKIWCRVEMWLHEYLMLAVHSTQTVSAHFQ